MWSANEWQTIAVQRIEAEQPAAASPSRPRALWPLLLAMGFLSLGGFTGGISMVADTSGAGIQADPRWLEHTPIHDFLLPGLFVLGVYGVAVLASMIGLIWSVAPGPLRALDARIGHHWAWVGSLAIGAILELWIVYEFMIFSEQIWLQPALMVVGLVMITIPLLPSMRHRYATGNEEVLTT